MKFLIAILAALCLLATAQQKYSDLSDSVTEMLLGLSTKGSGFSSVHSKIGALASNMDSKNTNGKTIQTSVLDLLNGLEQHASQ